MRRGFFIILSYTTIYIIYSLTISLTEISYCHYTQINWASKWIQRKYCKSWSILLLKYWRLDL